MTSSPESLISSTIIASSDFEKIIQGQCSFFIFFILSFPKLVLKSKVSKTDTAAGISNSLFTVSGKSRIAASENAMSCHDKICCTQPNRDLSDKCLS